MPSSSTTQEPECQFCVYAMRRPNLVIYENERWSVFHVAQRWPVGSIYLVPKRHAFLHEVPPAEWAEGGRMLPRLSKLLLDHTGAERTYLLAFSELYSHLHLILVAKRPEYGQRHGGKHGVALLDEMLKEQGHPNPSELDEMVVRLRERAPEYLNE